MAKDKISRKELLKKEDAFIAAAGQGAVWVAANRRQVLVGAALVIAVIVGTWAVVETMHSRNQSASLEFQRGLELLGGQVLPEGSETPADPTADPPTFASEKEQREAARAQFEKAVDIAGSKGVGALARFFVADLAERLGDAQAAEQGFVALTESLAPSESLYFLAVERAAYLREARGDQAGAQKLLDQLVRREGGFYRDFAIFHQARLWAASGEVDRARKALERVGEEFPTSPVAEVAKDRLAALPAPAAPAPEEGTK